MNIKKIKLRTKKTMGLHGFVPKSNVIKIIFHDNINLSLEQKFKIEDFFENL